MNLWAQIRRLLPGLSPVSDSQDFSRLEGILHYRFNNYALLQEGLAHRSIVRVRNGAISSNERLEFLGDSVLGLVISDQLYRDNPNMNEGALTKMKAMLVNESTLSRVAIEIGFNDHVVISPEEEKSGGRERASIVSDAFEAVIGAIYLDGGLEAARRTVLECVYARREAIVSDDSLRNYKGDLLELIQSRGEPAPQYEVVRETGPDHDKTFCVVVWVGGQRLGEGTGASKKEAEQRAAGEALTRLEKVEP